MTKNNKCRYEIVEKYKIIDTLKEVNEGRPIYIREILDSGCAEYNFSSLSREQRVDIIEQLGLDNLTKMLAKCFKENHKEYDATNEAAKTYFYLTGDRKIWDDYISKVKKQLSL